MGAAAEATQTFGKYTLVAKLAMGGMAEIFLARLQGAAGFEKLVCIKRILPHLARDKDLVSMFLAEAQIAAQISHPNVCQVFELGEIDGSYFIAMEYLEGVPLACFRRRDLYPSPPDPRLVAGLGIQACEGLHHAHNLKRADGMPFEVVHRDVSANNLFATVDGVVKVLDFGIAKIQDASVKTSTGSVKGTYAYMAPEQLRGERLDRRVDVFALGTVLWEMFGRRHLFKRDTEFLTFQAITTDPIPDVAELRPDVPPALSDVIAKALARRREDRYPTARAFGEALAQAVASLGGPLSAGAISDEIEQAFEVRLRDQRGLIRVAREGGALELAQPVPAAVGHGTALMTTPASSLSVERSPLLLTNPPVSSPSAPALVAPPIARPTVTSMPSVRPSRLPVILLVALALGAGAVAAFFIMNGDRGSAKDAPVEPIRMVAIAGGDAGAQAAPPRGELDAATVAPIIAPVDAAAAFAVVEDTAVPTIVADDAAVARPAVTSPPTPPAKRVTRTQPDKRPPPPPVPTGPPGFITIDSAPVYAVIFIDGKKYGETPLVRIQLPPGTHKVRAVSPAGASRNLSIKIEPGKVAPTRRIEW